MPVKNRAARLRVDPERELRAWKGVFRSGYDYIHALKDVGVPTERHQPPLDIARDAWGRLGTAYLERCDTDDPRGEPWALRQIGPPAQAVRPRPLRRR